MFPMINIMDTLKIIDTQNTIIKIQSDVINELFLLLMNHIEIKEIDNLPVINKINLAAELRRKI